MDVKCHKQRKLTNLTHAFFTSVGKSLQCSHLVPQLAPSLQRPCWCATYETATQLAQNTSFLPEVPLPSAFHAIGVIFDFLANDGVLWGNKWRQPALWGAFCWNVDSHPVTFCFPFPAYCKSATWSKRFSLEKKLKIQLKNDLFLQRIQTQTTLQPKQPVLPSTHLNKTDVTKLC